MMQTMEWTCLVTPFDAFDASLKEAIVSVWSSILAFNSPKCSHKLLICSSYPFRVASKSSCNSDCAVIKKDQLSKRLSCNSSPQLALLSLSSPSILNKKWSCPFKRNRLLHRSSPNRSSHTHSSHGTSHQNLITETLGLKGNISKWKLSYIRTEYKDWKLLNIRTVKTAIRRSASARLVANASFSSRTTLVLRIRSSHWKPSHKI